YVYLVDTRIKENLSSMTRLFAGKIFCATMFVLFGLSLAANTGSAPSFGKNPALVPDKTQQIADSPWGGPDPYGRDERADSPWGGPDPYGRDERADSPWSGPDPYGRDERADSPWGGPDPYGRDERADSPWGGPDPYGRDERA